MRTPLARTNVNNTAGARSLFWFDVCGGGEGADGGPARAAPRAGAAPRHPPGPHAGQNQWKRRLGRERHSPAAASSGAGAGATEPPGPACWRFSTEMGRRGYCEGLRMRFEGRSLSGAQYERDANETSAHVRYRRRVTVGLWEARCGGQEVKRLRAQRRRADIHRN